jgi:hypothetical protein
MCCSVCPVVVVVVVVVAVVVAAVAVEPAAADGFDLAVASWSSKDQQQRY